MSTRTDIPKVAEQILAELELPNEPTLALAVAAVLVEFHQRIIEECGEQVRADSEREHGRD